jgi:Zn-dependent protease/CBS domain-containing protein
MKGSLRIAEIAGIVIFVHWTFLILLAWIAAADVMAGQGWTGSATGVAFIVAVFGCVVLHELGHALMARRYDVKTRDITLLPIGGVARLERIPEDPTQEFWIAVAGPAVNVVIAAVLFVVLRVIGGVESLPTDLMTGSFLVRLMWVNVALFAFNLLPAFPMDGGRVLRALLARRLPYAQATQMAASVGQSMAILLRTLGLFFSPFLLFIELFIYIGAQGEAYMAQMRSVLQGIPVRDAMVTRFRTVAEEDSIGTAVDELLAGCQHDFPVVNGDDLTGLLTREGIIDALNKGQRETSVGDCMRHICQTVDANEMLDSSFQRMQEAECSTLPVLSKGELVGILTRENITEWIAVDSAIGRPIASGQMGTITVNPQDAERVRELSASVHEG